MQISSMNSIKRIVTTREFLRLLFDGENGENLEE